MGEARSRGRTLQGGQPKPIGPLPIRLDNMVLESTAGWAVRLHQRHIGDFTCWKDHDAYQKAFTRLLRDLKAEAQKESKK